MKTRQSYTFHWKGYIQAVTINSFVLFGAGSGKMYPYFRKFAQAKPLGALFRGTHFLYPTISDVKARAELIRRTNVVPDSFAWMDCQVSYERAGLFSWSYGSMTAFECPLKRDARFYSLNSLEIFLKQNPARQKLCETDAEMMEAIIRGFPMYQKVKLVATDASFAYKFAFPSKDNTTITITLADLAAYAMVQDLAQELNAIVPSGFANFLMQCLQSAKQSQSNPTSRATDLSCHSNALVIAALQFFQKKFIFSSLGLLFLDKRSKVPGLDKQHARLSKDVNAMLQIVQSNNMPSNVQQFVKDALVRLAHLNTRCYSCAPLA